MSSARRPYIRLLLIISVLMCCAMTALAAGPAPTGDTEAAATSSDVVLLVLYVLLALVFSFLCSVAEAVLLSITPSYVAGLQASSPKLAARLKKLKQDNVDRSLAAILTLNTIAHTVGAIGSGAKATVVFGSAWFGAFSAVMTLMILFLSEIIPKTLGAVYWRRLAAPTALFVQGLIYVLYPLIIVSELLTRLIARGKSVHAFSREEFVAMAGIGEEAGHLDAGESRIIRNLFLMDSLKAPDVMTPRTVIVALQQDLVVAEAMETKGAVRFSRLPVYGSDVDDITGLVLKDALLLCQAEGKGDTGLTALKRDILAVPATMPLSDLLDLFLERRQHIAVVTDEYGGTAGVVTLEDVVETLLGAEIVDEADRTEDMQALARKLWAQRAKALGLEVEEGE